MTTPNPISKPLTPEDLLAEAQERLETLCRHLKEYRSSTVCQDCYKDAVAFLKRLDTDFSE